MIWDKLEKSFIFARLEVESYQEIMSKMGGELVKRGYAKESYIEALIKREEEFPTGLDVDGVGVAVPHTDVEYVKRAGIAIGILKRPVTFKMMATDDEFVDVRIVFMLAVVDPHKHLDQLQRIFTMIQDKKFLEQLLTAKDTTEIIEVIRKKEQL
ncbi:PTS galactitol transporter subunit IIA [Clostridia bacterium]|nr:PTS galactitol transporter subunit IIA [Clostridia bacterium]